MSDMEKKIDTDKDKEAGKKETSDRKIKGITRDGVVKLLEARYGIKIDEYEKDSFRAKFRNVCRMIPVQARDEKGKNPYMTNLWDASVVEQGTRKDHYLYEHEAWRVLDSPELDRYIKRRLLTGIESRKEEKEEYEKLEEIADEWNKTSIQARIEEIELIEKIRQEINQPGYKPPENPSFVTLDEARKKAMEIMIQALYLRYFEPIDIELLRRDMELQGVMNDQSNGFTPEVVRDLMRLENPVEAYCKPREPDSKN